MEIIHVFYMLLLLLFLIVLSVYVKKHGNVVKGKNSNISELERFYYGPKSYLSIVKIVNEVFVLGVTENNINYLKKIEDKESLDLLKFEVSSEEKNEDVFSEILKLRQNSVGGMKKRLKKMRENKNEEV